MKKKDWRDAGIGALCMTLFVVFLVALATRGQFTQEALDDNTYVKRIDLVHALNYSNKINNERLLIHIDSVLDARIPTKTTTNTLN